MKLAVRMLRDPPFEKAKRKVCVRGCVLPPDLIFCLPARGKKRKIVCMKRMLVFGGNGRTGQALCRAARAAGWELLAPSHAECDLLQAEQVSEMVLHSGAHLVVNCAAVSGLEACLDDPLSAHLVNAVAPATMALACRHTGARFIHLSTDYVLDGRRAGIKNESAKCRPLSVYGESKREGEQQVLEAWDASVILRVSWICGNPDRPAFVESSLWKALRGEPLAAVADKDSFPTHVDDIVRVVLSLYELPEVKGVLHVCSGGEPVSWHDCVRITLQAAHAAGALPAVPEVQAQTLAGVRFFREERPRHTAMDNSRLLALGIPMPTVEECLQRAALGALRFTGR